MNCLYQQNKSIITAEFNGFSFEIYGNGIPHSELKISSFVWDSHQTKIISWPLLYQEMPTLQCPLVCYYSREQIGGDQ